MTDWQPPDDDWVPPTAMEKVQGFRVAWKDWKDAGFPRRSDAWIRELFETCCRPCDWYDPDKRNEFGLKGICRKCGCHVGTRSDTMLNGLVLPTKGCPDDPPKFERVIDLSSQSNEPFSEE